MTKEEIAELIEQMPQGMDANDYIYELVNRAVEIERGYKTPLSVLNLTVRSEHLLKRGRVHDVETLRAMDAADILAIPGFGKKALNDVNECLLKYENIGERKRMREQRAKEQGGFVRDDLIRMAVQCKLITTVNREGVYMDALAEFAELVAGQERGACERLCIQGTNLPVQTDALRIITAERERIAESIRARGEK